MFRTQALQNRKLQWRGKAIVINRISPWVISVSSITAITAFILLITLCSYTRRIQVVGEITTSPRPINLYANTQGVVVKHFVTPGQHLNKGDAISLIDSSRATRNGVVSENQKMDIHRQIQHVDEMINGLTLNKNTTLASLEKQKQQYAIAYQASIKILENAKEGIKISKVNMENYRQYRLKGLVNQEQLTSQESAYYQQQNNLLGLSSQSEQNALQVITLSSQIQTQAADFDNRIYQLKLQRNDLQKELINTDAASEAIIRTLSEGTVDSINVTPGQMVNTGDNLLQIMPTEIKDYYLVVWATNDALPYLALNDKVNIRYEAFPAEKFGQFSGTVQQITSAPASPQEMQTYRGAPQNMPAATAVPYYKIVVKPDQQAISANGRAMPLKNGMKAQVTLFLEKRAIYQWMFSPFYHIAQSTMDAVHE